MSADNMSLRNIFLCHRSAQITYVLTIIEFAMLSHPDAHPGFRMKGKIKTPS